MIMFRTPLKVPATATAVLFAMLTIVPGAAIEAFAKTLSADELSLARTHFAKADVTDDGNLRSDEFQAFVDLNADARIGRSSTIRRLGMYSRVFDRMDADGNGVVSWQEFSRMVSN